MLNFSLSSCESIFYVLPADSSLYWVNINFSMLFKSSPMDSSSELVYSVSFYLSSVSLSLILFFTRQQSLLVAWLAVLLTMFLGAS